MKLHVLKSYLSGPKKSTEVQLIEFNIRLNYDTFWFNCIYTSVNKHYIQFTINYILLKYYFFNNTISAVKSINCD